MVIRPDDTVVIRIARSEMGQGTLTGLAQLVAEELECDWSKVTTEYPTPGENVARKRVWGNFSTGGSRGIRESNEYVRKGGAAARDMLIRAAAARLGRAGGECSAANSVITHMPIGTDDELRQGRRGGRQARPAEATSSSRTRRTGRLPARREAARHRRQGNGKQIYGIDIKIPGHADRGDPRLPDLRRQGEEL